MSRRPANIPEDVICRAAGLLIQQHGANAGAEALRQWQAMRARGDDFGQLVWSEIRRAILGLQPRPEVSTPDQGPASLEHSSAGAPKNR